VKKHAAFKWKDAISGFPVSPGSAEALVRCGGKIKYILIPYFLGNICAKNCRNRTVYVKSIASCKGGTFFETRCKAGAVFGIFGSCKFSRDFLQCEYYIISIYEHTFRLVNVMWFLVEEDLTPVHAECSTDLCRWRLLRCDRTWEQCWLTFVDGGSCDVIEHESGVHVIDVLEHLKEVDVLIQTDTLHNDTYSNWIVTTTDILHDKCTTAWGQVDSILESVQRWYFQNKQCNTTIVEVTA